MKSRSISNEGIILIIFLGFDTFEWLILRFHRLFTLIEEDSCILNVGVRIGLDSHIYISNIISIVILVKLCWIIQITNNNENLNWDWEMISKVEMGVCTEKWVSITAEISTKVNSTIITKNGDAHGECVHHST